MNNTEVYEVQAFNTKLAAWVRIGSFTGVTLATAKAIWQGHARESYGHVRLILVDAPTDSNVVFGSASENPVKAALDAARSED